MTLSEPKRQRIHDLVTQGYSYSKVAKKLGISESSVYRCERSIRLPSLEPKSDDPNIDRFQWDNDFYYTEHPLLSRGRAGIPVPGFFDIDNPLPSRDRARIPVPGFFREPEQPQVNEWRRINLGLYEHIPTGYYYYLDETTMEWRLLI